VGMSGLAGTFGLVMLLGVGPFAAAAAVSQAAANASVAVPTAEPPSTAATPSNAVPPPAVAPPSIAAAAPVHCLPSGDGYLRAHVAGAVEARIDWPDQGTRCEGESKDAPPGVRLSFQRAHDAEPNLLFVFGLTGVREGRSAKEVGANLTLIVQGSDRIYGTLGDSRCTVDSLHQKRLGSAKAYRVEARGFCTRPRRTSRICFRNR
jgi:hypothetical protein